MTATAGGGRSPGGGAYAALAADLRRDVCGDVRFDDGSRALYATDGSNYRQVPIGVVLPKSVDDVLCTLAACRRHDVPVLPRGGGTSLAGQCCNVAVVIDMSRYLHEVEGIDEARLLARVQPGCVLDRLQRHAASSGLVYGPDPATHDHNTIGGMLGNNSCGVHSVMSQFFGPGPRTADQVETLDVVTGDGVRMTVGETSPAELARIVEGGGRRAEIYRRLDELRHRVGSAVRERYPRIPRRVSGYNLDDLLPENGFNVAKALVGSEGTCVTILGATVKLMRDLPGRALLVLGYEDIFACGDHVPAILEYRPVGLEGIDGRLIDYMRRKGMHHDAVRVLPEGGGWLLVEFGAASRDEAVRQARACAHDLRKSRGAPSVRHFDRQDEEAKIWALRESGLGATAQVPGMPRTHPGWEDAAVPPDVVGSYLRDFEKLLERYGYEASMYGHLGQGCIHCRIDFDFTSEDGTRRYREFTDEAADLVLSHGGSLSGEHGDGQSRAELLGKMFGEELVDAFREFKSIWDPDGRMNPGKVVDPRPRDADLRLGPHVVLPDVATHFAYAGDDGRFAGAVNRCVGVGACRREQGGVMCPSYMATREERHSTRGRARLLFEMLEGSVLRGRWRNRHVREALDLCLACKGCKSDCPVNVDMATYKAEFMSHHYRHRLRPRAAYSMGLVYWWSRGASRAPRLVNGLLDAPLVGGALKRLGGIAPARSLPRVAGQSFTAWFRARSAAGGGEPVMLWPDTFMNFYAPEIGRAAVHVLEAAGFEVRVPSVPLCCGRPLYAWGMLPAAVRLWRRTLDVLGGELGEMPLVGLEPACVAAFKDELPNLMRDDVRARRLAERTSLLGDFLAASDWQPPALDVEAVVQAHCNHHAVMGLNGEKALLDKLGVDFRMIPPNCCGMAGSFGLEHDKCDLSERIARQTMVPAIEDAGDDVLVVADGFSCREQIRQTTDRRPLHVIQLAELALRRAAPAAPCN